MAINQVNFILHEQIGNTVGSEISSNISPTGTGYNPIYATLDSVPTNPEPGEPIKLMLSLPENYYCTSAKVFSRGTSSIYWDYSATQPPADLTNFEWKTELTLAIQNKVATPFWVRARTYYGEQQVDDTSTPIKVYGAIREVR